MSSPEGIVFELPLLLNKALIMPLRGSSYFLENKNYQEWLGRMEFLLRRKESKVMRKLYIISNTYRLRRLYLG